MKNGHYIFAIACLIVVVGCASNTDQAQRSISRFYGNFCGAGHPNVNGTGRQALDALSEIEPLDDIDRACKHHDICYTAYAAHAATCDRALLDSLEAMRFSGDNELACNGTARLISSAFVALPLRVHPNDALNTLLHSAVNTIGVLIAPVALWDFAGAVPSTPCVNVAKVKDEVPDPTQPAIVPPMDRGEFSALSSERRCERLGSVAFNATYSRDRGASLEQMRQLVSSEAESGFSTPTLLEVIDDVYSHHSLGSYAMATVHWLRCMRAGLPGPSATLRPTAEVRERVENCQYISLARPFQVCVASALVGRH